MVQGYNRLYINTNERANGVPSRPVMSPVKKMIIRRQTNLGLANQRPQKQHKSQSDRPHSIAIASSIASLEELEPSKLRNTNHRQPAVQFPGKHSTSIRNGIPPQPRGLAPMAPIDCSKDDQVGRSKIRFLQHGGKGDDEELITNVKNYVEQLESNFSGVFKSTVHTGAVYDSNRLNGISANGQRRARNGDNKPRWKGKEKAQSTKNSARSGYERRSPAARYFSSEYVQMRMAGYEEDSDSGDNLLLKPIRPATSRSTKIVSPTRLNENEIAYDPKGDYVICTIRQLKELVGDRTSSTGYQGDEHIRRPQPRYRPIVTPRPKIVYSHRDLVDHAAQTNDGPTESNCQNQVQATSRQDIQQLQYSDEYQQRIQDHQLSMSLPSIQVQHQQRQDGQNFQQIAKESFGNRESYYHADYDPNEDRTLRSTSPSWRRLYYISPAGDVVKNRITKSQEILSEERYEIDLQRLKEHFAEKSQPAPAIERTGRIWRPPPEQPYEFPQPRQPYRRFVEYIEDKEHSWHPLVFEPALVYEKTLTSPNGPTIQDNSRQVSNFDENKSIAYPAESAVLHDPRISSSRQIEIYNQKADFSPGYSSMTFSDQQSTVPYAQESDRIRGSNPSPGFVRLENEPTPRHPSTITVYEKPRVNIRNKILSFENEGGGREVIDPRAPRREFGVYHTRADAVHSTAIDDDLMSSAQSSIDRRSVHFANGAVKKIQPPPQLVKKELEDLAELAQRRERLLDRARHRSAVNVHELRKVEAEVPPVPTRDRYKELLEEAASYESYTAVNGAVSQSSFANSKQHSELTRSQSSEWEYTSRQPRSLSQTNLASWKFSGAGFSPRSVVSINGHQDLGDQLRIRTDLSPAAAPTRVLKSNAAVQTQVSEQPQQPQFWPAVLLPLGATGTPSSTMTRELKEETKHSREVERYSSMNDLDDGSRQGTLIKIHDETARRPKSIMKTQRRHDDKQLMVKENWDTTEHRVVDGGEVVRHIAPKVTETVSTVEETKRTEEVERRVRESKDKKRSSKKKGSSSSGHHRESRHQRSSSNTHTWGPRPGDADYPPWTAPFDIASTSIQNGEVVEIEKGIYYNGAHARDSRINRESPNAAWRQQNAITNGHSGQRYTNGHAQPVTESYHRQTTTKRVTDNGYHRSTGSLSPYYNAWANGGTSGGETRYQNGHRSSGRRNRVHKSHSSREVYHNDLPEDYEGSPRTGRGPIIEYPPTLPRDQNGHPIRVNRNGDVGSDIGVHKSRSYNDWDGEPQRGKDTALMRKWEADMSGLERDFRDSLLMPIPGPGQNVNQREYREEQIPGGHETFSREVHANSGSRPNVGGANTRYSEAKQELSFRREQASDRRPY